MKTKYTISFVAGFSVLSLMCIEQKINIELAKIENVFNSLGKKLEGKKSDLRPDPSVAVGGQNIVATANGFVGIFDKNTLEKKYVASTSDLLGYDNPLHVHVVYDDISQRFILSALLRYPQAVIVSVTKDSNPKNKHDFFSYIFYCSEEFPDNSHIAVDEKSVYLSYNAVANDRSRLIGNKIVMFDKESLIPGASISTLNPTNGLMISENPNDLGYLFPVMPQHSNNELESPLFVQPIVSLHPDKTFSGNVLRLHYLVEEANQSTWRFTDVIVDPFTGESSEGGDPFPNIKQPAHDDQSNTSLLFSPGTIESGVISNNQLWVSHVVRSKNESRIYTVRWYQIDLSGLMTQRQAKLIQSGEIYCGQLENTICSSLHSDRDDNMVLQCMQVSENHYPTPQLTARLKNSPLGYVQLPLTPVIEGKCSYSDGLGNNDSSLGHCSCIALDPNDSKTFYAVNAYPYSQESDNNSTTFDWATYIARFRIS